ncbi:MAG: ATP-binding cassette domain-containing protein [Evtepia gabavorous]
MIHVSNFSKQYQKRKILTTGGVDFPQKGISFIMGANGSGKTTFLKCIAGLENYTGDISLCVPQNEVLILWDDTPFYPNLSGTDNIKLFAPHCQEKDIEKESTMFFPSSKLRQKVKHFSYGEKKKLSIILAILKDPSILIMDEITNGLDYESLCLLKSYILRLSQKRLIILTGHQFAFYDDLPIHTVVFIHNGSLASVKKESTQSLERIYHEEVIATRTRI